MKLLRIDSSPFGKTAISRCLTEEFVQRWRAENRKGIVITRDLTKIEIPVVDAAWVSANYTPQRLAHAAAKRDPQILGRTDQGIN